jgi:uncharacterized protein YbjQ (UPF0145 family)
MMGIDPPWAAALSADGLAAITSVGFEPVGQVFGAVVYQLSAVPGVSCPGTGSRYRAGARPPEIPVTSLTTVSGQGIPGPAARIAQALHDGRRTALDRMAAGCAELGGHGIVGAALEVREIPADSLTAGAVEFRALGTAVRARDCPPLARPFTTEISGPAFAKLLMAGWVPAGIVLGVSVTAQHDDLLTTSSGQWGTGNAEVPAYTDLMAQVRHDARSRLALAVGGLGADGVVVSAVTLRVRSDACQAHAGGTDHFAEAVITGSAVARFAGWPDSAGRPLSVLPLREGTAVAGRKTRSGDDPVPGISR